MNAEELGAALRIVRDNAAAVLEAADDGASPQMMSKQRAALAEKIQVYRYFNDKTWHGVLGGVSYRWLGRILHAYKLQAPYSRPPPAPTRTPPPRLMCVCSSS